MHSFSSVPLLLATALALPAQTPSSPPPSTPPEPATAPAGTDKIHKLDAVVVSAGPDPKTAFDLAQGTSVLTGEQLHHIVQATLGETLNGTAGVGSTYYGPGASRPIVRGLGGDRVRVLDNGIGPLDASSVSPDHNTAIEPLFASRIEVLRGPSTLLYGSSAVGGAVNVISNAIPAAPPDGEPHGAVELRAGGAARERSAVVSVGGGAQAFAAQVNAMKQKSGDVRIPGVARIDPDAPADQPDGILPNSANDTFSGSLGGTLFWGAGHAGAAVSHFETNYGVPTGEDVSIRMRHTRFDFEGEVTSPFDSARKARLRLGNGDYRHSELTGGRTINTTFTNRATEGRIEVPHAALGKVSGTLGAQAARSDFAAIGEEVVTPPSVTESGALFVLEEFQFGPKATLQIGGRYELQKITLGDVDPAIPVIAGYSARSGQAKTFGSPSGSIGAVFYPAKDWSIGANLAYTERVPTAQELFSNGPHGATATYEIGTPGLHNERSVGFDLSLRRRAGFVTGMLSGFTNRFSGYIFEEKRALATVPAARNPEGLAPFQFVARDAKFSGFEAELSFHVVDRAPRHVHVDLMSDYVRAEQTDDHQPLPRIPPRRHGVRASYEDGRWNADLEVRHAARQDRFAPTETATPGYTLVNASASYLFPARHASYEIFVRGKNLLNEEAREHTSFLKEFAPLPGRGVLAGLQLTF